MDWEVEKFLRSLGLKWINIAQAMSGENQEKTRRIVKENPEITKAEFLRIMEIEEYKY